MPTEDYKLASDIARYSELQDIRLLTVSSDLMPDVEYDNEFTIGIGNQCSFDFDEEGKLLHVFINFVVQANNDNDELFFGLKSSFELTYTFNVKGGPGGEELERHFDAFANINGLYNAWPFFREHVHSTATRMGISILLPVHRVSAQEKRTERLES